MYKRLISLAFAVFIYQLLFFPIYAVKAYPHPFCITQPDGTQLTVWLKGDEIQHIRTTEDGYMLKANSKGFLTYATLSPLGEVVESEFVAKNAAKRSEIELQFLKKVNQSTLIRKVQSYPQKTKMLNSQTQLQKVFSNIGSPKSLVILVNFLDNIFTNTSPQTVFSDLLNQSGYSANGGTGSARDYFMASSYGKFAPDFDVFGPVTLPQTLDYYGKNDSNGRDINPMQMVIDACTAAYTSGLDFTKYDNDKDGIIDNIFICYAGYNEAEGGPANSVWPNSSSIYPSVLYPNNYNYTGTVESITFNGKRLLNYACTSELQGNTGSNMCGIGTFCHEFGHVIGLPDYYDTSGKQTHTLDYWNIMDAGNYNNLGRTPPVFSAFDRFYLGYLMPEQISTASNLTLLPLYQGTTEPANTMNQAFLISATTHNLIGNNPNPNEFFMLEYRKQTGWDAFLPSEGMCIWHIDYSQTAWDNNIVNRNAGNIQTAASHMRLFLQPLNGIVGTTGSAFTTGSFIPTSWLGEDINRTINNISKTSDNITFGFMPPKISNLGNFSSFATNFGTPSVSQTINISALNLNDNLSISFQNTLNFEIKLSTETSWSKSLILVPTLGAINISFEVRYNPKSTGIQTDQLNITSEGLTALNFSLNGTSTIGTNSPVIYVGKVDNSLLFYPTKLFTINTKTINIKTSDIVNNLTLAITGKDALLFTISASSIAKAIANGITGNNITLNYLPTTPGAHMANLTISGGGLPDKVILLKGSGY